MASRRPWSRTEVEATVAAYVDMLSLELRGQAFNKAERNRQLRELLDQRSHGAVERKHQNISAILLELGLPYVEGYKPLRNYQELLRAVAEEYISGSAELDTLVEAVITRDPVVPAVDDLLRALVEPPLPRERRSRDRVRDRRAIYRGRPNYLRLEARNAALGNAGELFVVNFERARLLAAGADRLAASVEQVSVTRGDHLGFDILSFDPDGRERLVEVKTTGFGPYTPFYVTRTELEVSQIQSGKYEVSRVFAFRRSPQLFRLPGAVDETCDLEAEQFLARVG